MKNFVLIIILSIIYISSKGQYIINSYKKPVKEPGSNSTSWLEIKGSIEYNDVVTLEFREECGPQVCRSNFDSLATMSGSNTDKSTQEKFLLLFFSKEESLYKNKFYDRETFLIYKGKKYFFSLIISDERVTLLKKDTSGNELKKLVNEFNEKVEIALNEGIKFL